MTQAPLVREPLRRRAAPVPNNWWVLRLGPVHYWFLLAAIGAISSIVLLLLVIEAMR